MKKKDKSAYLKIRKNTLTSILLISFLLISTFFIGSIIAKENINNNHPSALPTVVPTTIPSVVPTSIQTKAKVYPTTDPNPIITCNIHASCGGGSRQLKKGECDKMYCCLIDQKCGGPRLITKSECDNGICCQIGSTWIFYPSKDKCTQDQKASQPVQQVQQSSQNNSKLNFYCYDNTNKYSYYTSSGEQCNKNNASSACQALIKSSMYDPCMQKCLDTVKENNKICMWGYFGTDAAVENNPDMYKECTDQASKEHEQCMDACSSPYQEALKKCY